MWKQFKTIEIEDAHIPFVCRNIIYYSISYFKYFYYCCCLVFDIIGGKDIYIYIYTMNKYCQIIILIITFNIVVLSSHHVVISSTSIPNDNNIPAMMKTQELQDFIEKEILTDGTTLESLLEVEENVRNGASNAAESKHKLLSKTKSFLANKIANHLLNQHEMGLKLKSPDSGADASTEGCREQLDSWMNDCVFA